MSSARYKRVKDEKLLIRPYSLLEAIKICLQLFSVMYVMFLRR